jgi:hypothetical protein
MCSVVSFIIKLHITTSASVRLGAIWVRKDSMNFFFMPLHAIPALELLLTHRTLKQFPSVQSHMLSKPGRRFKHFVANFTNKLILRIMTSHMFIHITRCFKSFIALVTDKIPPVWIYMHGHFMLGHISLGGGAVVTEAALVRPVPEPVHIHVVVHVAPGREGLPAGSVKARILAIFVPVPSDVVFVYIKRLLREI